jgi:hypothetical protein
MSRWLADAAGLSALAGILLLWRALVPGVDIDFAGGSFLYLAWAAGSIFVWHHQLAPKLPAQWLLAAACSIAAAAAWYGFMRGASVATFGKGEPEGSKVFDMMTTIIIAPGLTGSALCGSVRALIERQLQGSKRA